MTVKEAEEIAGSLSFTSKMPGPSWSISARRCKTGSKLRSVKGTVCNKCYAMRGNYNWPALVRAQAKRLNAIRSPRWVPAMVTLIEASGTAWFRWFDSGDIQSTNHLRKIYQIARALPGVNFWIPTKEYKFVEKAGPSPANVVVRLSAHKVDAYPPPHVLGSMVVKEISPVKASMCNAKANDNQCGACRACWDPKVRVVAYPYH